MEDNGTIEALQRELAGSSSVRQRIRENLVKQTSPELVLNLVQLEFDFESKRVNVTYYVEDRAFPESTLSFEDLAALLP